MVRANVYIIKTLRVKNVYRTICFLRIDQHDKLLYYYFAQRPYEPLICQTPDSVYL